MRRNLDIVMLGLTITSSWGNGHAATYRGLVRELVRRGHYVLFLERDVPWYAGNRDLPSPPYGHTELYSSLEELRDRHADRVRRADLVLVGSCVPDGVEVGRWVQQTALGRTAFYDMDTPATLAALARGDCAYLDAELIPRYDLYLSFTGGPTLERLEKVYGSPMARALYGSVDPELCGPRDVEVTWDLGYLGTYTQDRQPPLERLMLDAARRYKEGRFVVAGPQYPHTIDWPPNVARIEHLAPPDHPDFYSAQRFTLNVTRLDRIRAGYSPSVRLLEAAACGTPIISDYWDGIETVLEPGRELLISRSPRDTLRYLKELPDADRRRIGEAARACVLAKHTAAHRAQEFEQYALEAMTRHAPVAPASR